MSRRHVSLSLALLAVLAFALAGWHARDRRRIERELVSVTAHRGEAKPAGRAADGAARVAHSAAASTTPVAAAPAQSTTPATGTGPQSLAELHERWKKKRADPSVQNAMLASYRVDLANLYGLFFRRAGLSPAQAEALKDILLRHHAGLVDLAEVAEAQGISQRDPALASLRATVEAQRRTALRDLLGEARVAQLEEYDRSSVSREMASRWVGEALAAGIAFAPAQVDEVANALAPGHEGRAAKPSVLIEWEAMAARLRPMLSQEQFEFIELRLRRNATQLKSEMLFHQAERLLDPTLPAYTGDAVPAKPQVWTVEQELGPSQPAAGR